MLAKSRKNHLMSFKSYLFVFFVYPVEKSADSDISGSAPEQSLVFDLCLLRCHLKNAEDSVALNVCLFVCLFNCLFVCLFAQMSPEKCGRGSCLGL